MLGQKLVAAAFLLPQLLLAHPNAGSKNTNIQKLEVPVAKYCGPQSADSHGLKSADYSESTGKALAKEMLEIAELLSAYVQLATIGIENGLPPPKSLEEKVSKIVDLTTKIAKQNVLNKKQDVAIVRADPSGAVSLAPLPTYIPPPNTEVTQQLLQESLLIQPQQLATVGSVIPHFADGVITFLVQLDGPISQTLALNATDTLPCESIGTQPAPSLILVPKTVKNGVPETVLPNCLVIAVNMYDPQYITYWVQKEDGSVFTLLSDNKIHAIDQLDTSQPASVAIRVASANQNAKRFLNNQVNVAPLERRQIFSVACDRPCPFQHMEYIKGSDGYCGCIFKSASQKMDLIARSAEQVNPYTAMMTAEACAAMTCVNNGGKPALFNPFTAACWCASPTFVEENKNAYNGGM